MKPVFEKERLFLKERGIEIPSDCWREGNKIYLNLDKNTLLLQFKIEHKNIIIKKDKRENILNNIKNLSYQEEIQLYNKKLNDLEQESINKTIECIKKFYPLGYQFRVSNSTGKDSLLSNKIFEKALLQLYNTNEIKFTNVPPYEIDFFNTSNDTPDTYLHIKKQIKDVSYLQLKLILNKEPTENELNEYYQSNLKKWIHNPKIGWSTWLKEVKHYYLPSILVRNCCSTYKEGQLKQVLNKKKNYVLILGMRKYESAKRANYDWYLNDKMDEMFAKTGQSKYKCDVPKNWVKFCNIVNWKDEEVWLYILRENLEFNPMYNLGFNRVGCLCCPYSTDYNDLLIEYWYPYLYNHFCDIIKQNYILYDVKNRLKWTENEYVYEGKWKAGTSKEHEIISKKPTKERIKELSDIKGCSEEIALKYFQKICKCGKKLNADEIAMYLKLYGRYEGKEDTRTYLCQKCLCEDLGISKKEYSEKKRKFRDEGCKLF